MTEYERMEQGLIYNPCRVIRELDSKQESDQNEE